MRKIKKYTIFLVVLFIVLNSFTTTVYASEKNVTEHTYSWTMDNGKKASLSVEIDMDAYHHYFGNENNRDGVNHKEPVMKYIACYLEESTMKTFIRRRYKGKPYNYDLSLEIANSFKQMKKKNGWSQYRLASEIVNFVQQNVKYVADDKAYKVEEYVKYPVETLVDRSGDCEDMVILAVSILRRCDFDAVIIDMVGHVGAGIAGKEFSGYRVENPKTDKFYYYIEMSSVDWKIGEVPDLAKELIETKPVKIVYR